MRKQVLAIGLITIDPRIQPRVTLDEDRIEDYRRVYEKAKEDLVEHPFPIIRVCKLKEDGQFYVTRGFRRLTAADRAGHGSIQCEVFEATLREAILDASADNGTNGDGYTVEDKRNMLIKYLQDPEWSTYSTSQLAEMAHCSRAFATKVIEEFKSDPSNGPKKQDVAPNNVPNKGGDIVLPEAPAEAPVLKVHGKDGKAYPASRSKPKKDEDPAWMDDIPKNIQAILKDLGASKDDMERLAKYNMDDQRDVVRLIDGDRYTTLGMAIAGWENPNVPKIVRDPEEDKKEVKHRVAKHLSGMRKTVDSWIPTLVDIQKEIGKGVPNPQIAEAIKKLDTNKPIGELILEVLSNVVRPAIAKWSRGL